MFKYIFWAIVLYLAIRFIFNFVIPVFRATRQMKRQMKDFQHRMNEQQAQSEQFRQSPEADKSKVKREDYIDFEEIK